MFRKLLHISLSILLLTVTAGFSVSKHYCKSNLVSVSITQEAETCCDLMGEKGCCRNETKSFQLDENFVISSILENDLVNSVELFAVFYIVLDINFHIELINDSPISESPPPLTTQSKLSRLQTYLC
ncbi:MAG: hypothetical protein JEY96_03020 [Bacteroidales bacterium]|nr:hypothetical protein [Bacteroidales bacterium]